MYEINIYWDDITKEKQDEILDAFGENGNYDVFPITTLYCSEDDSDEHDY